jgi:hypothetical protein
MLFGESRIMATLKEHEILCEQRYKRVEERLGHLETKIDEIHTNIDGFKDFLLKLAIKTGLGLIVSIAGAVFVIKL